ncbi:GNAT family N-acetyltransferase [Bradyrhizobium sp. 169]|uniref:GNAT family N-acetyltransferase n=1 Tax=Bradyrhizobium sp. 169 TaxID=2782640 RepID=UPI0031F68BDE
MRCPGFAGLHTPDEDRWFYREHVLATCRVWGRFDADVLSGIIAVRDGWVEQLYVLPAVQGRGVGTELLDRQAGQRTAGALDLPAQRVGGPLL